MVIQELYALLGFKVEGEEGLKKFDDGIKKASGTLSTFQAGLAGFAGGLAAGFANQLARMAGQVTQALNPLSAAGEIAPILDNLIKFADRTGVAFDALQELQFAAGQSGASVGEFQSGIQNISKNLAEAARGTGRAKKALEDYGLSAKDAGGNVKSADTFLGELADKFQTLDEGQQLDLASKLGISPAMVTMLKSGNAEIEKLRQQARDAGLIFTEEDARNAEEYNDTLSLFTQSIRALRHAIGVEALPMMTQFLAGMQTWFNANREMLRQNIGDFFVRLGRNIAYLSGIVTGIGAGPWKAMAGGILLLAMRAFPATTAIVFLGFAIDDLLTFMRGGDSVIGDFGTKLFEIGEKLRTFQEGPGRRGAIDFGLTFGTEMFGIENIVKMMGKVEEFRETVKAMWSDLGTTLSVNIWQPFEDAWDRVAEAVSVNIFAPIGESIQDWVIGPINRAIEALRTLFGMLPGAALGGMGPGAAVGSSVGANIGAMAQGSAPGGVSSTNNNDISINQTFNGPTNADQVRAGTIDAAKQMMRDLSVSGGTVATP
jgi:hypothetical protein